MADRHVGLLGCAKLHFNRCRGVGIWRQNIKIFHFLVKDRLIMDKPLYQFLKVLGDFMRTIILRMCFKFDTSRFRGYGVIADKPHVGHLG